MNKKLDFSKIDIMAIVWEISGFFITVIRGILIIGGGAIASSLADVILGALTLDLLLVNTAGAIESVKYAPVVISMGASGIQLILWQIIQNRGGLAKIIKSKDWVLTLTLIGVILMKFADDFMDISIVNYLMVGSSLPVVLGTTFFSALKGAVLFISWMLTGFSEIFVVNAIDVMKHKNPEQQKQEQKGAPQQHQKPKGYQPTHRGSYHPNRDYSGDLMRELFGKGKHKD